VIDPEPKTSSLDDLAQNIEYDIKVLWGIDATVIVNIGSLPPQSHWIFQQISNVFGYINTPVLRTVFPKHVQQSLNKELEKEPAYVVAHRLPSMFMLTTVTRKLPPTFFDLDDVEHMMTMRSIKTIPSIRSKIFEALSIPSLLLAERRAIWKASLTFVCSEKDAGQCKKIFRTNAIQVIPNSISIPPVKNNLVPKGTAILMVGMYLYGPNSDGADYFISEIFPLIKLKIKDAKLLVVGKGAESLIAFEKEPEGVSFLGFVEELDTVYRSSRLVICPIRYGSGTRVKLVEAAAWGKAIVSTTIGAEGLGMNHGVDILLADNQRQFADSCIRLLQDDALCLQLGNQARELAERNFDKNKIAEKIAEKFRGFA